MVNSSHHETTTGKHYLREIPRCYQLSFVINKTAETVKAFERHKFQEMEKLPQLLD